jgi:L-fucose isomerase
MLRIPVYMHNVPRSGIFRPSAWTLFGANEPMGADFRACANFGPLYWHESRVPIRQNSCNS